MWLRDYHADGLRIDAIHSMLDRSATPFLEQLAGEVAALETQLGRSLVLIAESDLNDPRILRPSSLGGYGLAAQWSDDFHHAVHALLTGERDGYYADFGSLSDVIHALQHTFVYDGRYSHYRGRRHGRSAAGLSGHRFVAFIQNHDQVGNRARGERLSQILVPERLKLAAGLLLCGPFVPLLFQGEEWGASTPFLYFTDHRGEIGDSVRDGRKREFAAFGWDPDQIPDPQAFSSFYRSKLDWAELEEPPHSELLQWYRTLIALRARRAELRDGSLERVQVASDGASRWLQIRRGSTLIALNLAPAAAHVPLHAPPDELLARSTPEVRFEEGGLVLPPSSVAIAAVHAAAGSGHPAAAR
jgi:maltooligosyltrehalose trehalohydrolase